MNYEDRTDLKPPGELVSGSLLARLRQLSLEEASALMVEAISNPGSARISSAAVEAIARRAEEDTGPERGAPTAARAVEVDAMVCGYRFGVLVLGGPLAEGTTLAAVLYDRAEAMYLYDLISWRQQSDWGQRHLRSILVRGGVVDEPAMEEAVVWAWAFGLGLAVVEADLSLNR